MNGAIPSWLLQRQVLCLLYITFFISPEGCDVSSYLDFVAYFESPVLLHEGLESFCQSYVVPDVFLQTGNSVVAYHEPQFKGAESSTEWNSPVSVVYCCMGVAMLWQVKAKYCHILY
jgi:hypothetical protein